jgi:hypothetical protein
MRIIPQENKKVLSVLGLPHSGTTIISNTFNSMKNAFCISEPHWILLSNPKAFRSDKIGKLGQKNINDIMPAIKRKLDSSNFDFGGVKETYRPQDPKVKKYLDKTIAESDILVFVFRHPKALYNSFKKVAKQHNRNFMPVDRLLYDYNAFYNAVNEVKKIKPCITLTLEDYCSSGNNGALSFINKRANGVIKVVGNLKLTPTNYIYGNTVANQSKKIQAPNLNMGLVTDEEHDIIDKEVMPIYNEYLDGSD